MNNSKKRNIALNIASSWGSFFINFGLSLVSRSVFIYVLSVEYLGLTSLFANIISILSLVDLGLASALIYSMYHPIATKDYSKISALLRYYKILYRRIAVIVLVLGLSIAPFLSYIVKLDTPIDNLYLYYLLALSSTVLSYFLVYKTSLLIADQKSYIIKNITTITTFVKVCTQIAVLLIFKSFLYYLILQVFFVILNNYIASRYATRKYPEVFATEGNLDDQEKKSIWNNIKSLLSNKVGGVILNNTDIILISTMLGTAVVGLYSNYWIIVQSIVTLTSAVFISCRDSIGNFAVHATKEQKLEVFKTLNVLSVWIYGFSAISLCVLLQDFVNIWLGEKFLINYQTTIIIAFSYYICGFLYPIYCYRESVGLFKYAKYVLYYTSAINLILSIILGNLIGLPGILIATPIARLLTTAWYEPRMLYKFIFQQSPIKYFIFNLVSFLAIVIILGSIMLISAHVDFESIYLNFIFKMLLCLVIPNILFATYSYKTNTNIKNIVNSIFKKYFKSTGSNK